MRNRLLGYGAIVVLSVAVGVFIGGGPGALVNGASEPTRPQPVDDDATTTTSTTPPTTTISDEPEAAAETTVVSTTAAPTSTETTEATTSPTTTEPDFEPPETVPTTMPVPFDVTIAVANGANISGIATERADRIAADGFTDVVPVNASGLSEVTTIYHAPGLEQAADRIAAAALLPGIVVSPWDDRPDLDFDVDYQVLLLLGTDLQPPP